MAHSVACVNAAVTVKPLLNFAVDKDGNGWASTAGTSSRTIDYPENRHGQALVIDFLNSRNPFYFLNQ